MNRPSRRDPAVTRQKLVEAAIRLILRQGFPATTVDAICAEAGVTKGSFFHYFESKEAIGLAAADAWGAHGTALYAEAWQDAKADPLDQLHRFFEIMDGFTRNPDEPCTCVVGMLSQEMSLAHSGFRDNAAHHLTHWTENVKTMLAAAKEKHPPVVDFDVERVAWFLNSLWQGSMLVAKTIQSPEMIRANLRFAREWIDSFFGLSATT